MGSFSDELKKAQAYRKALDKRISDAVELATLMAINATIAATPPLSVSNSTTGELKAHWRDDSDTKPVVTGRIVKRWRTTLRNNKHYASFVNDGHRMDRHFVPGLIKTEEGLQYFPQRRGKAGIVVGTKTKYVPGVHMAEVGEDAFDKELDGVLENITEGL